MNMFRKDVATMAKPNTLKEEKERKKYQMNNHVK